MFPLINHQDEYAEVDGDEEQLQQQDDLNENDAAAPAAPSTTTTTTEPPKKVGPIIRPFRSNDDLLSALKRRQQNTKTVKKVVPQAKTHVSEDGGEEHPVHHVPSSVVHKPSHEKGKLFCNFQSFIN